jgi:hypothetical protein
LPGGQTPASAEATQGGPRDDHHIYEARLEDCQTCTRNLECCPDNKKHGRSVAQLEERPLVIAFRKKIASEETQQRYRRPGGIVAISA